MDKSTIIQFTVHKSFYLDECISHLEKCLAVAPKGYMLDLEEIPEDYQPSRHF